MTFVELRSEVEVTEAWFQISLNVHGFGCGPRVMMRAPRIAIAHKRVNPEPR